VKTRVQISGGRELAKALRELPRAVERRVLVRAGKRALQPVADRAALLAPVDANPASTPDRAPGTLSRSYHVGTRLNARQRGLARKAGRTGVYVYAGTNDPAGIQTEFGNVHQSPQPHFRPAWDAEKDGVVEAVSDELWDGIVRQAKKRSGS
jgi:hypothetical protein